MSREFAVVCAHFYPALSPTLLEQYRTFRAQFVERDVPLVTMAVGEQYADWAVAFPEVHVVAGDLLFQKERLWALGVEHAERAGYERFLCLDADVIFEGEGWPDRLSRALRKFDVVHPFEHAMHQFDDLENPRTTVLRSPWRIGTSRRSADKAARKWTDERPEPRVRGQPLVSYGFGIAFNARFFRTVGLYEHAIVGGGDKVLWYGLLNILPVHTRSERAGRVARFLSSSGYPANPAIEASVTEWIEQGRARLRSLRIGYLEGVRIVSLPHGRHDARQYRDRYQLLCGFDPAHDLRVAPGEALRFDPGARALADAVGRYIRDRIG